MMRPFFSCAALLILAGSLSAGPLAFGINGTVESIGQNFFMMDADGTEMKVLADANTVFRIDAIKVSAAYVVKGTKVNVAGATDRPGLMNATLVTITPSTESISGTVKKVDSKYFMFETEKGDTYKVYVAKFTKIVSGKISDGGFPVFGKRPPVKKEDGSKIRPGAKLDITPVTAHPDLIDAWEINVRPDEPSAGQ